MNARRLGLFCIVGGIAYIINAVYISITGISESVDMPNSLLTVIWSAGAICGWLAVIQLKGTGENTTVRSLPFIPILGLSIVLISSVYGILTTGLVTFNPLFATGFILELIGSVLVGIFVIAARRLSEWHRFAPFFVVLGVIAGGLVSALTNNAILGIPLFIGIAYTLLGYAVRTEKEVSIVDHPMKVIPG
jgi:hypothetical protein